ncbi:hypothetical protein KJ636_02415 [Patescibacteria group bacterium]|nr:hypothetical protein [Patescibacteria group bacterium]
MIFNPEGFKGIPEHLKKITEKKDKVLPEDHWFKIAERLYNESSKIPDPLQIRASAIVEALGIPSSQYSALEVDKEKRRINPEKDKIIAKYLTNKAGVLIDKETGIVSSDFRDMYPKGLPQELKEVLDPATAAIMEAEYKHTKYIKYIREKLGDTKGSLEEADCLVHYFRLAGGIDLFLRGYSHNKQWQEIHGEFLKEINKQAKVICVEAFEDKSFGMSLDLYWSDPNLQRGHYDALMHQAVDGGFEGLFTEIDARDTSKIRMDRRYNTLGFSLFPKLPSAFFDKYFDFLQKELPSLTKIIGSPENLKQALIAQSTTEEGLFAEKREKEIYRQGKHYHNYPYFSKEGKVSFEPTFLELGQLLFSDALSAVKLHLIAKLMSEGHIEKGPIIDYGGTGHLSSKSFFLREPGYAMEVVLRTVNELMAGRVKKQGNIPEIYQVFENPNWSEIVKEIAKLSFKKPENDPSKPTAIGPDQLKLIDKPIDFLKTYNINPEKVMPSDEKIKEIREKLGQKR